jgi:uncharacterized protein YbbK (DUF523 family)
MAANRKIKVAISSCLLGNNVRYDGGNKLDQSLLDAFGENVEWVPICPEVGAGLSVPREPMQLVADGRKIRCVTIETRQDVTDIIVSWAEGRLRDLEQENIRGYVFKARSPSCGVRDAGLFSPSGESIGVRAGLFAEAVMNHFPSFMVEDEGRLCDPVVRERLIARFPP